MGFSWNAESAPAWDAGKHRIVGGAPPAPATGPAPSFDRSVDLGPGREDAGG